MHHWLRDRSETRKKTTLRGNQTQDLTIRSPMCYHLSYHHGRVQGNLTLCLNKVVFLIPWPGIIIFDPLWTENICFSLNEQNQKINESLQKLVELFHFFPPTGIAVCRTWATCHRHRHRHSHRQCIGSSGSGDNKTSLWLIAPYCSIAWQEAQSC